MIGSFSLRHSEGCDAGTYDRHSSGGCVYCGGRCVTAFVGDGAVAW